MSKAKNGKELSTKDMKLYREVVVRSQSNSRAIMIENNTRKG